MQRTPSSEPAAWRERQAEPPRASRSSPVRRKWPQIVTGSLGGPGDGGSLTEVSQRPTRCAHSGSGPVSRWEAGSASANVSPWFVSGFVSCPGPTSLSVVMF